MLDRAATIAMYMREAVIDDRLREGDLLASQGVARYDDPVQFSADHPDCCRIVALEGLRAEEQPPNWARIAGAFRAYVLTSYDVGPNQREERLLIVDNCGGVSTSFVD